jgi:hypothetical protein
LCLGFNCGFHLTNSSRDGGNSKHQECKPATAAAAATKQAEAAIAAGSCPLPRERRGHEEKDCFLVLLASLSFA